MSVGEINAESTLISCPFELAITQETGLEALRAIHPNASQVEDWSERMLVASYIVLHWLSARHEGSEYVQDLHLSRRTLTPDRGPLFCVTRAI